MLRKVKGQNKRPEVIKPGPLAVLGSEPLNGSEGAAFIIFSDNDIVRFDFAQQRRMADLKKAGSMCPVSTGFHEGFFNHFFSNSFWALFNENPSNTSSILSVLV